MAQLDRTPRSTDQWTNHDLLAFNIEITSTTPIAFFGTFSEPSLDHLDPNILTSEIPLLVDRSGLSEPTASYLGYLDLAVNPPQEPKASFNLDFAAQTLRLLRFSERDITTSTRHIIPFEHYGEGRTALVDVSLIHRRTFSILLLLTEDKPDSEAEARIVAQAVATFEYNNGQREECGLPRLGSMTIPCIIMSHTCPTFYLVPVTEELSYAVITGEYPETTTSVLKCGIPSRKHLSKVGMMDREYRRLALQFFLAFRQLAESHWTRVIEGLAD